ncbi:MAG: hypothetical protein HY319_04595 [Armatimonadetes bacterium]|nr:hypothetical protein [Armatimonadota bacterium]
MPQSHLQISKASWVVTFSVLIVVGSLAVYYGTPKHRHGGSGDRYIGPGSCAKCHEDQAASWKETRMARSFECLKPGTFAERKKMVGLDPGEDYTHDEFCLHCHTTGYGLVGGFVSIEDTPEMAGVTCEACHGPGGLYATTHLDPRDPTFEGEQRQEHKAHVIYPPKAAVCIRCHNEDSPFIDVDFRFDYEERVKKGTHQHFQLKYGPNGEEPRDGQDS